VELTEHLIHNEPFSPSELVDQVNARIADPKARITFLQYQAFLLAVATVEHQGYDERPDATIDVKDPATGEVIGKKTIPHVDEKGDRLKVDKPYDRTEERHRKLIETSLQNHLKHCRTANRWPDTFSPVKPGGLPDGQTGPDPAKTAPTRGPARSGAKGVAGDGTTTELKPE
jgi:hypothetical protein